jgi:hypothetical protein
MMAKLVLVMLVTASLSAQKTKPNLYFAGDQNAFSTNGRWVPSDAKEKAAYPSETQIDCQRQTNTCTEATAEYFSGHPHVTLDYFEIIKWDENGIIATSADGICMTETMIISFADKKISNTHSVKHMDKDKREACKAFGAGETSTDNFIIKNSEGWLANPYGSNGE